MKSTLPFFCILGMMIFPLNAAANPSSESMEPAFDILIQDAMVFDGVSIHGTRADIGISGERIVFVGKAPEGVKASQVVHAKGLVAAPGFIDVHTHSDFNPLIYPKVNNKIRQGVTTEIVGNCGMSAAPVIGPHAEHIHSIWAREGIRISSPIPWVTFGEYKSYLEQQGMMTHFAALVGHGNIRSAVIGMSPRPASDSEIEDMKKILAQAMTEGAYGISFGLPYLPGIYAEKKELAALCQEAGRAMGVCAFHIRDEGPRLLESLQEALEIGEAARTPIQISHLKADGKANWSKIGQAFEMIAHARRRGVRVMADAYPYNAGYAELARMLPDAIYQREDRNAYFQDLFLRRELLDELRKYDDQNYFKWDSVMIADAEDSRYQSYEGMTLKQAARKSETEPEQFLINILADTRFEVSAFYFSQREDVVDQVLQQPYVVIGSDSEADGTRKPHPRCFGTFPKVLREALRGKQLFELGVAIRKMTSLTADHFGLKDRGRLVPGAYADLVLFDAGSIQDQAVYKHPTRTPAGIRWVFVQGTPVLQDGNELSVRKGIFLVNDWTS